MLTPAAHWRPTAALMAMFREVSVAGAYSCTSSRTESPMATPAPPILGSGALVVGGGAVVVGAGVVGGAVAGAVAGAVGGAVEGATVVAEATVVEMRRVADLPPDPSHETAARKDTAATAATVTRLRKCTPERVYGVRP
jgi:hypothetical protein